jgi:hypothetical protein
MGKLVDIWSILIGEPERKRSLGRPRLGLEDNIRIDIMGIGCEGEDWIHLAQDRGHWRAVMNTV